jgi:hypothetical protein
LKEEIDLGKKEINECPNCKSKNVKPVEEIEIDLPTPKSEIVFGQPLPEYTTVLKLPFKYCEDCGLIFMHSLPEK